LRESTRQPMAAMVVEHTKNHPALQAPPSIRILSGKA
jgi:hypothetical protein